MIAGVDVQAGDMFHGKGYCVRVSRDMRTRAASLVIGWHLFMREFECNCDIDD